MSKEFDDKIWTVTLIRIGIAEKARTIEIKALTCKEQNGALIFKGGPRFWTTAIIACGQWTMVERCDREYKPEDHFIKPGSEVEAKS